MQSSASQNPMRRAAVVLLAAAAMASGCASLTGTRDLTLTQADLQAMVARQFPRQQRVFDVIYVNMTQPVMPMVGSSTPANSSSITSCSIVPTPRPNGARQCGTR